MSQEAVEPSLIRHRVKRSSKKMDRGIRRGVKDVSMSKSSWQRGRAWRTVRADPNTIDACRFLHRDTDLRIGSDSSQKTETQRSSQIRRLSCRTRGTGRRRDDSAARKQPMNGSMVLPSRLNDAVGGHAGALVVHARRNTDQSASKNVSKG